MKKQDRITAIAITIIIAGGVLLFFYFYVLRTEVSLSFDSSRAGSNLYIDSEKVKTFTFSDTSDFEHLTFFLGSGVREIRLSKPGKIDIVDSFDTKDFGGEYYAILSWEFEH